MDKSPEAFRTISEVAEALDTPAHVLRFWESRFPQIRPVKRAGGRRYYRPSDVALLSGIRHLLHDQGMTIRGVQKMLREQGVRHVAGMAEGALPLEEDDATLEAALMAARAQVVPPETESAEIVELAAQPRTTSPAAFDSGTPSEVLRLDRTTMAPSAPLAEPEPEAVPEARHAWVEDHPQLDLPLSPGPAADSRPAAPPLRRIAPAGAVQAKPKPVDPPNPGMFDDIFIPEGRDAPLQLSGLAARIRALPRPLSPEALLELSDLHNRLGLLHAQIAEALRERR